ncbi:MAG: type IX secretion system membrane protein PorP/SprF [Bacteroidales bacterium]|jgi:type IX secretion system PorP/SprF family membrane protein|nr:type IX secretion system membrane protein PorP/SprF [Bacteroidales bacterium]
MNKKKYLYMYMMFLLPLFSFAQQDPQFSQNMFSQMSYNPGYVGSEDKICVAVLSRQQWVGFGDGSPKTSVFNFDAAINPFGISSGIGLSLMKDEYGFNENYGISIAYAYKLNIGNGSLGIGVNGGIINEAIDANWYVPESEFHQNPNNDPAIPGNESAMAFDMGVGVFYRTQDLYVGFSSTHITQPEFDYEKGTPSLKRHYYISGGYNIILANPLYEIKPSVFVQSDGASTQMSINTYLLYNKKLWGGVSLRTDNSIVAMAGIKLFNWVKVGYSYDIGTSDISSYNDGSHEIMIGFSFDVKTDKSPKKYKSIRFL